MHMSLSKVREMVKDGETCSALVHGVTNSQTQLNDRTTTTQETPGWSLGQEDRLQKGMATHSSILAWRIPWAEEPGKLQSMGLKRVGHDWVTLTFTIIFTWSVTSPSAPSQPLSSTIFSLSIWLWGRQSVQRRFKKGRVAEKEGLGWASTMGFKIFSTEPSKCP